MQSVQTNERTTMMKICKRGLNFVQIIDAHGNCRACSWMKKNYLGSLLESNLQDIYQGKLAQEVRSHLFDGTYSDCQVDNCPYLANGTIEEHLVEIEKIPDYPSELYLAYEGKCNYNCTCCTSYLNMREAKEQDWSNNYDKIEEHIREVLPYVKKIGANGRGELFCSNRILGLLHDWAPLAPADEIFVELETNGSLFNETNWKKIENLGQYHLRVAITVMSFQEDVYQYLSGTKLPVSNIVNNLHFVKKLREQGIINELEIATVLQEQNFREMPEFVHKCIEEFSADSVRIRPIVPGGPMDTNIQWFMDVRNPYHPYYHEYKKVMENSIFKHPKVLLWSGDYDSERGDYPGIIAEQFVKKDEKILNIIGKILVDDKFIDKLAQYLMEEKICKLSFYGIGKIAQLVLTLNYKLNKININNLYDNYSKNCEYLGHPIIKPADGDYGNSENQGILVTVLSDIPKIEKELRQYGFLGKIFFIEQIIEMLEK